MKAQKILIKSVYSLAGLLFLTSVGYNIYQHQQFRIFSKNPVSDNITKTEPANDSDSSHNFAHGKTGPKTRMKDSSNDGNVEKNDTGEIKEVKYHLDAAEEELEIINKQLAEEQYKKEEYKKARAQLSKSLASTSDPARQKRLKGIFSKTIENDYDPLFKKLDIPMKEFEKFKVILIDREMELSKLLEPYSNASTKEEKEILIQQEKEIYDDYHNKVADFLGEEKNEIYQSYVDRFTERRRVKEFMEEQSPENRIDEKQAESLIDIMYEARKAVYDEKEYDENEISNLSYPELTEDKIKRFTEIKALVHEKYVEAGRAVMSPDQLEKYKEYLKQHLDMEEASLKISLYLDEEK